MSADYADFADYEAETQLYLLSACGAAATPSRMVLSLFHFRPLITSRWAKSLLFCCFCLNLLFTGCASFPSSQSTNLLGIQRFEQEGISVQYQEACFEKVELKALPKKLAAKNEMPWRTGPKRWTLQFTHTPRTLMVLDGPRYFQPPYSAIFITPLRNHETFFSLNRNVQAFRSIFDGQRTDFGPWLVAWNRQIPPGLPDRLPDEPWNNAGEALCAKFRILDSPRIHGFRMLTYYVQGKTGYGATNAELLYNFQGITKDGKYYISARLAVRNPALPDSIDDPKAASDGTEKEVKEEQRRVNSWNDDTFFPNLNGLDKMIESITVDR